MGYLTKITTVLLMVLIKLEAAQQLDIVTKISQPSEAKDDAKSLANCPTDYYANN